MHDVWIFLDFEWFWYLVGRSESQGWILMMAASYVFVSLEEPCFGIVQEVNTLKPPSPLVGHLCSTVVNTRDAIYSSLRQEHPLDTQQKLHSSEESFIKLIIAHVENAAFFVWSAESYQWYSLIQLQGMLDHVCLFSLLYQHHLWFVWPLPFPRKTEESWALALARSQIVGLRVENVVMGMIDDALYCLLVRNHCLSLVLWTMSVLLMWILCSPLGAATAKTITWWGW